MFFHRRANSDGAVHVVEPRTVVRLIEDDDELREALERAAASERTVAAHVQHRLDRYDAQTPGARPPATVVRHPAVGRSGGSATRGRGPEPA